VIRDVNINTMLLLYFGTISNSNGKTFDPLLRVKHPL
jgi:hypothetical protein